MPRGRKLVLQYTGGSPCGSPSSGWDKREIMREDSGYKNYNTEFDDDDDDEGVPPLEGVGNEDEQDEDDDEDGGNGKDEDDKEDDDDKEDEDSGRDREKEKDQDERRKSATISFLCDHDPDTPTAFSFIGTDPDQCAYFFEVRSQHACAGAEPHKPGSVGPGSVFAIIFFITVLVYVMGGVFYQRTVAHARGWRQLPNYSLWAGIWSFIKVCLHCRCLR